MGLASLPDWMEFDMTSLKEVLSNLEGPELTISLSYKYELKDDNRIRVFKEFLLKEIKTIY